MNNTTKRPILARTTSAALWLVVLFLFFLPANALAKTVSAKITFGRTDTSIISAIKLTIPDGYHAYSHDTLATGRPTELDFSVANQSVPTIFYPKGAAQRDVFSPENSVFVYEGDTYLFAKLPYDAAGKPYSGAISLLLCSKRNCIPVNQDIRGIVPIKTGLLREQAWYDLYTQQLADADNTAQAIVPPPLPRKDTRPLPPPERFQTSLTPEYASSIFEITTLSKALLFGILAGLLLNIMPCVLPVLTFKMSGLLMVSSLSKSERIHNFRVHNSFFALGIIIFFSLLALILGLADMIWGQLFQSEAIILCMLVLVFGMALSLLQVFSLPIIDIKISGTEKKPRLNAFVTGFVTTFLATPCSGPLLGGVLGWAFTQPLPILMLIFWSIGLGMSAPYILFCIYPRAVLMLPNAGPWMNIVEHIAGFFLIGTSLYLLSILPQEKYIPVLAVLLCVAIAAWLWGQYCGPGAPLARKRILAGIAIALLALSVHWILQPSKKPVTWKDFSQEYFASNLGQKILFIEFTADWCPNCKLVEKTVLTDNTIKELLNKEHFELIKADLTQANAAATYLLTELGSHSIPLTAIFPKGSNAHSPIVIRDVYTTELLQKSFEKAVSKSN